MNLILGKYTDREGAKAAIDDIDSLILASRAAPPLSREAVISAADRVSRSLSESEHLPLLTALGMTRAKAEKELAYARFITSREYLTERVKREFGGTEEGSFIPYGEKTPVRTEWRPLGVLMHISAGNVDALPVFSVLEGLLTGNINILKLSGEDDGLSLPILRMLMDAEPLIEKYVFAFDLPGEDIGGMKKLASAADAVVLWGGDAAVRAVRSLAEPDTRLIEWGHKVSFAYVSGEPKEADLEGICENICDTNQLFCNSCQGVYLDTDDFSKVCRFAERFADILERVSLRMEAAHNPRITAQKTLELYTEELEAAPGGKRVFRRNGCAVIAYPASSLAPSIMFRNPWVRPLKREKLLGTLSKHKAHLNTACLCCAEAERAELEDLLIRAGVVRITGGRRMSESFCGAPHDGEMPLRRYMKIVTYEY